MGRIPAISSMAALGCFGSAGSWIGVENLKLERSDNWSSYWGRDREDGGEEEAEEDGEAEENIEFDGFFFDR